MVYTVLAGTGVIKLILQERLLLSSLHTQLHPVVVVVSRPGTRWVLSCMGECARRVVKPGCLRGVLRMASSGVGGLTRVKWFMGPVASWGCLVLPCEFLASWISSGLFCHPAPLL